MIDEYCQDHKLKFAMMLACIKSKINSSELIMSKFKFLFFFSKCLLLLKTIFAILFVCMEKQLKFE
jgi:hypothetical protein